MSIAGIKAVAALLQFTEATTFRPRVTQGASDNQRDYAACFEQIAIGVADISYRTAKESTRRDWVELYDHKTIKWTDTNILPPDHTYTDGKQRLLFSLKLPAVFGNEFEHDVLHADLFGPAGWWIHGILLDVIIEGSVRDASVKVHLLMSDKWAMASETHSPLTFALKPPSYLYFTIDAGGGHAMEHYQLQPAADRMIDAALGREPADHILRPQHSHVDLAALFPGAEEKFLQDLNKLGAFLHSFAEAYGNPGTTDIRSLPWFDS